MPSRIILKYRYRNGAFWDDFKSPDAVFCRLGINKKVCLTLIVLALGLEPAECLENELAFLRLTMFDVTLLAPALYALSTQQNRTSSQTCIGEKSSRRDQ